MYYKIWKSIITTTIAIMGLFILPFVIVVTDPIQVTFNSDLNQFSDLDVLMYFVLGFTAINTPIGLLTLLNNKKARTTLSIINIFLLMGLLIVVPLTVNFYSYYKLAFIIMTSSFVGCDIITSISKLTIQGEKVIIREVSASNQPQPTMVPMQDSDSLKQRILNMQSGLNKNIGEAIKEIQSTGQIAGIQIGQIEEEQEIEANKITPISLAELQNTIPATPMVEPITPMVEPEKKADSLKVEFEDSTMALEDISALELNDDEITKTTVTVETTVPRDLDYESIHETSLSRKQDTFEKNYPLTEEFEEWDTH